LSSRPFQPVEGTRFLTPRAARVALVSVPFGLLLATGISFSSQLDFSPASTGEILLAQRAISDTEVVATPVVPGANETVTPPPAPGEVHKSPGKAFVYNILLPGAGHLYAGNKRGYAHLGLEGVAWITYFYYHERGTSKEDEYLAYADDHWDYSRWVSSCNCSGSPEDSIIVYFRANNKQHYYEDIGKLNTYASGWDDAANRNFYRGMRSDSNNFLKNARYAVVGSFVNRIVSAIDVLRMLKNRSRALLGEDTRIRIKVRTKPFSDHTAVGFEIKKQL